MPLLANDKKACYCITLSKKLEVSIVPKKTIKKTIENNFSKETNKRKGAKEN